MYGGLEKERVYAPKLLNLWGKSHNWSIDIDSYFQYVAYM